MTDPVAKAVAAVEAEPTPVPMANLTLTLKSTGRQVGLIVPVDLALTEAMDLVGYVATALGTKLGELANTETPRPILVPTRQLVRP